MRQSKLILPEWVQIREQQNQDNSHLYRLPGELLVRVLGELRSEVGVVNLMSTFSSCRLIWSAALSTPTLWSYISFGDGQFGPKAAVRLVRLCAERSRDSVLHLRIFLDWKPLPKSHVAEIMKLAPRMRKCELDVGTSWRTHNSELCNAILNTNWPSLEAMDITAKSSGASSDLWSSSDLVLKTQLLGGQCQTLTTLRSLGLKLSLEALPDLPQLRHLELDGLHVNHTHFNLRKFLSQTSLLRSLKLQFLRFDAPDRALLPGSEAPLYLPHLTTLHLSGLPGACLYMVTVLSDSYKELRLDVECKKWTERDRDWHYQLFVKALNFADLRRPADPAPLAQYQCVHKRFIPRSEIISQPVIEVSPVPSSPCNGTSRTLSYRAANHMSMSIFTQISEFVTELHCETDVHHARIFATFASPRCTVQVLKLKEWKARWNMYSEQTVALKRALMRLREHRGVPLQVLWVDSPSADKGFEKQWLSLGLVQTIRYEDVNDVSPTDKSPLSSEGVVPLTYRSFEVALQESYDSDPMFYNINVQ